MTDVLELPCRIAGEALRGSAWLDVVYPYDGSVVGRVPMLGREAADRAVTAAVGFSAADAGFDRHARFAVLDRARGMLEARGDEFADLIRRESGLCIRETRYEVGRALDVLRFASHQALVDDGQVFSCDVSPQGKARKIVTLREPLACAVAITPFNHPLNQVVHKVAPAIAAGTPMVLKPTEKTPLTAIRLVELLHEAGLPGPMLSVVMGSVEDLVEPLIRDERVELVSFTGSAGVGKRIARTAGYKKLCLELGGNSPLIVLDDCDLDLAVKLACEGSFRNSGQRCTAVKRILVERGILDAFTARFAAAAAEYRTGDPADPDTRVGTVIDEPAAERLERVVQDAVARGARVLRGGGRRGAVMEPTVIADVPRDCEMVVEESFGPLAPILAVDDVEDAIRLANATAYGLSTGVVTNDLARALRVVRGVRTGTVNVNEVPGFRIESSPFGGLKDSGLGIKEGVIEAMRFLSNVKTFSLPW